MIVISRPKEIKNRSIKFHSILHIIPTHPLRVPLWPLRKKINHTMFCISFNLCLSCRMWIVVSYIIHSCTGWLNLPRIINSKHLRRPHIQTRWKQLHGELNTQLRGISCMARTNEKCRRIKYYYSTAKHAHWSSSYSVSHLIGLPRGKHIYKILAVKLTR